MTTDSYFMYYDKRVFTEEDVKNLDTMLEKGKVAIALSNGFYIGAFFTGSGAQFFRNAEDTAFDRSVGIVLNKDSNLAMANYLVDLAANSNFVNAEPADAISMMQEGSVNALWSGTWSKADVEAVLGDNMGVAILPSATVDGKEVSLRPYASAKAIGVKSTFQVLSKIIMPLSKPIIVYTLLTSFAGPFKDFMLAKVLCGAYSDYYTVAVGMYKMLEQEYIAKWYGAFAAAAVIISIPIATLFLCTQKYYAEGVSGAVKG